MDEFYDEDDEQLMDPDAWDLSPSPEPQAQPYDDLEDDIADGDGGVGWTRGRSPTPVHGDRPRKRLLKKGGKGDGGGGGMPADDLEYWGGDGLVDKGVDPDAARKGKGLSSLRDLARGGSGGKERHEKMRRREDRDGGMVREKRGLGGKDSGGGGRGGGEEDDEGEREIRELWDTIAGGKAAAPR